MTQLYTDNPSFIELASLTERESGNPIIDAAVGVTIYDSAGAEVTGESWPLAMPYDAGTLSYKGVTSNTLGLVAGDQYKVTVVASGTAQGEWNSYLAAIKRGLS